MAANYIKADYVRGMNFSADINGHIIQIDTDVAGGGNNVGPRPKALMLVSLAGCTGLDVVSMLNKMRVEFTNFSISVEGNLSESEPVIYNKVAILYAIKVADAEKFKVEKAVKLSKEKYCGVSKMFEYFAKVTFEIQYL